MSIRGLIFRTNSVCPWDVPRIYYENVGTNEAGDGNNSRSRCHPLPRRRGWRRREPPMRTRLLGPLPGALLTPRYAGAVGTSFKRVPGSTAIYWEVGCCQGIRVTSRVSRCAQRRRSVANAKERYIERWRATDR
jgi:hypothetical protein